MNTSSYKVAAVTAVLLAILFPIYWLSPFDWFSGKSLAEIFMGDLQTLDVFDILFVVIGVLEITVYAYLLSMFKHQFDSAAPSFLLILMMVFVALFHSTVFIDIGFAIGLFSADPEQIALATGIYSLIMLFLYAATAFIFAIMLLTRFSQLPSVLKLFAVGLLVACVFQFTVILGVLNIFLFPVLMLLLALHFYRGDVEVEVV